jgi:hypothetical protein
MRAPAAQLRFLRQEVEAPRAPASWPTLTRILAPPEGTPAGPVWPALLGCLAIAAITLLLPSTPTYDPWAWIMWGREIVHLDLVTTGGPSWKPLPILFTIPFSLFGDHTAAYLWLVIARAGGLLACVFAFRLARRFVGGWFGVLAGVGAALALFSSFRFVRDAALGNSEALMAALVLWAFERHLDGRRDHALYLGVGAALLRPETWPFLGLYGIYLWFRDPYLRGRLAIFAVLVPALWFLPEWWGSGDPFRASARANSPNPGSAAFAEHPALELIRRFRVLVIAPVKAGVVVALVYGIVQWVRHRRQGPALALAAGGTAWLALIAAMTQAGFAGNNRYVIITTAVASVLGGMGAAYVLKGIEWLGWRVSGNPRVGLATAATAFVVALGVSAPFISEKADNVDRVSGGLEHEATIWHDLKRVIPMLGGRDRIKECGGLFSGPFQTQMVAYELHVHGIRIGWSSTPPPGIVFRTRTVPNGPLVTKPTDDRYRQVLRYGKWRVLTVPPEGRTRCPVAGPGAPRAPLPPN